MNDETINTLHFAGLLIFYISVVFPRMEEWRKHKRFLSVSAIVVFLISTAVHARRVDLLEAALYASIVPVVAIVLGVLTAHLTRPK